MSYDVTMTRQPISAVFDLKGPREAVQNWLGEAAPALPDRMNSRVSEGGVSLYHIGPEHWLLRADIAREDALLAALKPDSAPSRISILRISDSLTFFAIEGSDADQIMSIACPLDLHPTKFDHASVSFSTAFGTKALVVRTERGFEIGADASYADMITEYLDRAAPQPR